MSYFFDVVAFLKHMEGVVDIVEDLPLHLQGTPGQPTRTVH